MSNEKLDRIIERRKLLVVAVMIIAAIIVLILIQTRTDILQTSAYPALSGRRVVIDAGHGGSDGGAIGSSGTIEAEINLSIAEKLKTALEGYGMTVVMTRETEEAVAADKKSDMAKRREIIQTSGQDVTVSIHQNKHTDSDARGPQVFYAPGSAEGEKLAVCIQERMNTELQVEKPRSAAEGNYYIVKSVEAPAVIVECGFISNPAEEIELGKKAYQLRIVKAIAEGLQDYFGESAA